MSERFRLDRNDLKEAIINALWFTAPVVLIYLYSVIDTLQQPDCVIGWYVFVPNNTTVIAMVMWVLNRFVDFFRRFVAR